MHNPCGKIFTASPEKILNMITTCPYCNTNISNGAAYVRTILEHLNLPYGLEFTFEDLKSDKGKYLRFDFNIIINQHLQKLTDYNMKKQLTSMVEMNILMKYKKTIKEKMNTV